MESERATYRHPRVDVDDRVELLDNLPEWIVGGLVVHEHGLAVWPSGLVVIDDGALESELSDSATELVSCLDGIVHGQ